MATPSHRPDPKNHYACAEFLVSVPEPRQAPPDTGSEVAFAGRSNAGKSSALNTLTGRKSLARTSKTPGRTQHLVFFSLDDSRRLVDLPGYGYARVPAKVKAHWDRAMSHYLHERSSLRGLVLMMDIRHPLTDFDQQMLNWCAQTHMPVHILLTKADKLKRGAAQNTLLKVRHQLADHPEISIQLFSALKRTGAEEARTILDKWLGYTPVEMEKKKAPE